MGGHKNENLPHWHLRIRLPSGQTKTMNESFERTCVNSDSAVVSGKVIDIYNFVSDQGITKPFTLYWQGKKLDNLETKIRQIIVEGSKIPLYDNSVDKPIVVIYNEDVDPKYVESHDLDLVDLYAPQTPR
jgi:hypothetical protein